MLDLVWKIPLAVVALSFGEWLIHKYLLHGSWIIRNRKDSWFDQVIAKRLRYIYVHHAVEHHALGRHEKRPHIDLGLEDYLIVFIVMAVHFTRYLYFGQEGGLSSFVAWGIVGAGHYFLWNNLHASFHDLEHNWTEQLPFYDLLRDHHIKHHLRPRTNFGVVFVWFDHIMGTKS